MLYKNQIPASSADKEMKGNCKCYKTRRLSTAGQYNSISDITSTSYFHKSKSRCQNTKIYNQTFVTFRYD